MTDSRKVDLLFLISLGTVGFLFTPYLISLLAVRLEPFVVFPLSTSSQLANSIIFLIATDFFAYWSHRLFHGKWLWRFHAIHHSARELDWVSANRVHPVNLVLHQVISSVPILILIPEIKPHLAAIYLAFFWNFVVHADVNWDFGPLRYLIVTPRFHRFHHSRDERFMNSNYSVNFPVWDLIFGTYSMPKDAEPGELGLNGDPIEQKFWAQLVYSFRSERR